jgi:hypothetical protein
MEAYSNASELAASTWSLSPTRGAAHDDLDCESTVSAGFGSLLHIHRRLPRRVDAGKADARGGLDDLGA